MSFKNIIHKYIDPTETFILEKRSHEEESDEIGNKAETWEKIKELTGLIQQQQNEEINESGTQSNINYMGFFLPDFDPISTNDIGNYRIKYINDYEKLYFKITSFDPNLKERGKRSHYEIKLTEQRKNG